MSSTTPAVSTSSWEDRIEKASAILGLSPEEVEATLESLGVKRDQIGLEMLSDESVTPFGDLRRAFCEEGKVKIAQLRLAIKYLRGPKEAEKASDIDPDLLVLKEKFGYKVGLKDMDPADLIQYYNPNKPTNPISNALRKHFKDDPVIAFIPGSKQVAVAETANYIADLQQGFEPTDAIEVNGVLSRLYPVGVVPNQTLDEDPLYEGHPLRRDRSSVNRVNWAKVGHEARQFCRLLVEADEVNPDDRLSVIHLVRLAEQGVEALRDVYPEIGLEFRERMDEEDLPKLKVKISELTYSPRINSGDSRL